MNSLIDKDNNYIGQCLYIKDKKASAKMFTKFYNLFVKNKEYCINAEAAKHLIHSSKFGINDINKIYVSDINTGEDILKSIHIGDYAIFINETENIFILNENEFYSFMHKNEYRRTDSIAYVLGVDNGVEFKSMHIISANNLETAKEIYEKRFNLNSPVCIGTIVDDHLTIKSDKHSFTVPLVM